MKYPSALKRKEILTRATTWMKLEDIILIFCKQVTTQQILCNFTYMRYLVYSDSQRQTVEWQFPEDEWRGEQELMFNEDRFSVGKDEKVLEMDGCTTMQIYLPPQKCTLKIG